MSILPESLTKEVPAAGRRAAAPLGAPGGAEACALCPVRQSGFCAALGGELATFACGSLRTTLPAGSLVVGEGGGDGQAETSCAIVVSGILRSVRYGYDGKRHVTGLTFPGELVGPQVLRDGHSVEAATEVRICRISRPVYERMLATSSDLRRETVRRASAEMDRLRALTLSLGLLTPEERLAAFLTTAWGVMPWAPLPGGGGVLTIVLSRADIADLLGTTMETISRITKRWHRAGVLRIRDPHTFEIADPGRLAAIGGALSQQPPQAGAA